MFFKTKKAVSPLIATVLLIAFAIALGAMIMSWGRSFVTEQATDAAEQNEVAIRCSNEVAVDWVVIGGVYQVFHNDSGVWFVLENEGTEEIAGIVVRFIDNNGNVYNFEDDEHVIAGSGKKYDFDIPNTVTGFNYISLQPKIDISGSSTDKICSNNEISLYEIEHE